MYKIDVKRQVEEMERLLRANEDIARRQATISVLRRWQFDEMLDDDSREKAKRLVLEFDWDAAETAEAESWPAAGTAVFSAGKSR